MNPRVLKVTQNVYFLLMTYTNQLLSMTFCDMTTRIGASFQTHRQTEWWKDWPGSWNIYCDIHINVNISWPPPSIGVNVLYKWPLTETLIIFSITLTWWYNIIFDWFHSYPFCFAIMINVLRHSMPRGLWINCKYLTRPSSGRWSMHQGFRIYFVWNSK